MTATLVDTNVLLDVATRNVTWAKRSLHALETAAMGGSVLINSVIYAEFSVGFVGIDDVEKAVSDIGLALVEMPRTALFLAGKAFKRYREAGGPRTGALADFFIGAHAAVSGAVLLTRDPRRYLSYFPTVRLVAP